MTPDLPRVWGDLVRAAARRRWLLAAGLVAGAVATALPVLAPPAPPGTTVLAAARDLSAGARLSEQDVRPVQLPDGVVPAGALAQDAPVVGQLTSGAVREGEALTDVRLVGPGLLAALDDPELVAVPVRLADVASVWLLRPGDRVDVLAAGTAPDGPASAVVVAAGAPVLSVPQQEPDLEGAVVLLATPPAAAQRLAGAAVTSRLSVVVRRT